MLVVLVTYVFDVLPVLGATWMTFSQQRQKPLSVSDINQDLILKLLKEYSAQDFFVSKVDLNQMRQKISETVYLRDAALTQLYWTKYIYL